MIGRGPTLNVMHSCWLVCWCCCSSHNPIFVAYSFTRKTKKYMNALISLLEILNSKQPTRHWFTNCFFVFSALNAHSVVWVNYDRNLLNVKKADDKWMKWKLWATVPIYQRKCLFSIFYSVKVFFLSHAKINNLFNEIVAISRRRREKNTHTHRMHVTIPAQS